MDPVVTRDYHRHNCIVNIGGEEEKAQAMLVSNNGHQKAKVNLLQLVRTTKRNETKRTQMTANTRKMYNCRFFRNISPAPPSLSTSSATAPHWRTCG